MFFKLWQSGECVRVVAGGGNDVYRSFILKCIYLLDDVKHPLGITRINKMRLPNLLLCKK